MTYNGKLLQCVGGEWQENLGFSLIAVSPQGDHTTVRHATTNGLQVDIANETVAMWNCITSAGIIIPQEKANTSTCIAFKFLNHDDFDNFVRSSQEVGMKFTSSEDRSALSALYDVHLPDISDPAVQEYILQLLLDDSFPSFVLEIQDFLAGVRSKIDTST